jgi:hypothetical protein
MPMMFSFRFRQPCHFAMLTLLPPLMFTPDAIACRSCYLLAISPLSRRCLMLPLAAAAAMPRFVFRHCFSPCRYAAAHFFSTPRDYAPCLRAMLMRAAGATPLRATLIIFAASLLFACRLIAATDGIDAH